MDTGARSQIWVLVPAPYSPSFLTENGDDTAALPNPQGCPEDQGGIANKESIHKQYISQSDPKKKKKNSSTKKVKFIFIWSLVYTPPEMVKESAYNGGNQGSIPRWGRSPRGGHGNPLQYYSENPVAGYSPWGRRVGHN